MYKRQEDDKILTKTMINNYAKNNLLPPPEKKRYSRDHILLLVFIYYFKNVLSFTDIEELFAPLTDGHLAGEGGISLSQIYEEVFTLEREQHERLKDDLENKFAAAQRAFSDMELSDEDREYLRPVSYTHLDVYKRQGEGRHAAHGGRADAALRHVDDAVHRQIVLPVGDGL